MLMTILLDTFCDEGIGTGEILTGLKTIATLFSYSHFLSGGDVYASYSKASHQRP